MEPSSVADAGLAGTVVAGTYRIERQLGRGGMGVVWEASHLRVPKRVAVKVLRAVPDPQQYARFRQEAEITSKLRHPNIVDILDFDTLASGTPCMVMELLEGESLAARLRQGRLPVDATLRILRQVASALHAAHAAGVVHRDLKPDNVFLVAEAGELTDLVKVLDFGISKVDGSSQIVTQDNVVLGTPQYMAPEQANGDAELVDERADQFALAVMAYEMLSGRLPFSGAKTTEVMFKIVYEPPPPLASVAPDVPADIVTAIERAMSKHPLERYPDVSAFIEALTGEPLASSDRVSARAMVPAGSSGSLPTVAERPRSSSSREAEPTSAQRPRSSSSREAEPTSAQRPRSRDEQVAEVQPSAAMPAGRGAPAQPAGRSRRVVLVASVVVVAMVGGALALILASGGDPTSSVAQPAPAGIDASPVASVPVDAAIVEAPPVVLPDAGVAVAGTPDAGARPVRPRDSERSGARIPVRPEALPAEVSEELAAGEAALAAGNVDEAEGIARRVLRGGRYNRAYMLLVVIACSKRELPNARGWLRQLPADQQAVARARCARAGFPLD